MKNCEVNKDGMVRPPDDGVHLETPQAQTEYFALIISYCLATIDILLVGESRERSNTADASRLESETILCNHSTQQTMRASVESLNAPS